MERFNCREVSNKVRRRCTGSVEKVERSAWLRIDYQGEMGWRLEVRGSRLESWRLEVGGWKLEVGGWKLEVRGSRLEVGGSRFEVGSSRLEDEQVT